MTKTSESSETSGTSRTIDASARPAGAGAAGEAADAAGTERTADAVTAADRGGDRQPAAGPAAVTRGARHAGGAAGATGPASAAGAGEARETAETDGAAEIVGPRSYDWDDGFIARRAVARDRTPLDAGAYGRNPLHEPYEDFPRSVSYGTELRSRLGALRELVGLSRTRLAESTLAEAGRVLDEASARQRLSSQHTVVAIAGASGSGKSTLFNALAGVAISETGLRRPTTSAPWPAAGPTARPDCSTGSRSPAGCAAGRG